MRGLSVTGRKKQRRIEHLNTRADLVHVFQARVDVRHLTRLFSRVLADIVAPADQRPPMIQKFCFLPDGMSTVIGTGR